VPTGRAEETPKEPLQDTKVPEEDGKISRALPEEKKKSKKKKGTQEQTGGKFGKNQAQALGDAPATTSAEPARQLLVNAVAAAAVLVGIIWSAWRNLSS
jgi:hypothetical protein